MTLFIDCDDTLMISVDGRWQPNTRLVAEIERWLAKHPAAQVVVWSGASQNYAQQVGQNVLPHVSHRALRKDATLPTPDDLAIDDVADLPVACPVRDPLQWEAIHD